MEGTNWSNITNFEEIIVEANHYAPFWTAMLYLAWVILVITFLPYGTTTAVLGGSFLAFILGLFLVYMGVVEWVWLLTIVAVIIVMVLIGALSQKKEW